MNGSKAINSIFWVFSVLLPCSHVNAFWPFIQVPLNTKKYAYYLRELHDWLYPDFWVWSPLEENLVIVEGGCGLEDTLLQVYTHSAIWSTNTVLCEGWILMLNHRVCFIVLFERATGCTHKKAGLRVCRRGHETKPTRMQKPKPQRSMCYRHKWFI